MTRITYTLKEAAEQLGVAVSTVRGLALDGSIRSTRVGAKIMVYSEGIDEYLRANEIVPKPREEEK